MGPIQQSLNSIATTAMDAIRTKEALASTNERKQKEEAEKDLNARVKQQEEDYVSGKIGIGQIDKDVQKELFGSRQQAVNNRRMNEALSRRYEELEKHPEVTKNMSEEDRKKLYRKQVNTVGDRMFFQGLSRFNSQETYQLSRIFDTMRDMVKGNRYAQQAAIQLSEKIDTALNHMQSRKRWR